MSEGTIKVERAAGIAVVTLDRPAKRNAVTTTMIARLISVAEGFAEEPDTRAVVFRGEGVDFCAGADVRVLRDRDTPWVHARRAAEQGARLMRAMREIHQPTIALVHGAANGGGACIASACDFRIGADNAQVTYGEVPLGINLMWHSLPLLIQIVGLSRAKRMVMAGETFDAAAMQAWGFFDEVVALDAREDAARALAARYAALPPIAVQMVKRSANAYSGALDQSVMHADADQWLLATLTPECRDQVDAFFRHKKPT